MSSMPRRDRLRRCSFNKLYAIAERIRSPSSPAGASLQIQLHDVMKQEQVVGGWYSPDPPCKTGAIRVFDFTKDGNLAVLDIVCSTSLISLSVNTTNVAMVTSTLSSGSFGLRVDIIGGPKLTPLLVTETTTVTPPTTTTDSEIPLLIPDKDIVPTTVDKVLEIVATTIGVPQETTKPTGKLTTKRRKMTTTVTAQESKTRATTKVKVSTKRVSTTKAAKTTVPTTLDAEILSTTEEVTTTAMVEEDYDLISTDDPESSDKKE